MNATSTAVAPIAERQGIITWAAGHFGVDAGKVMPILKATCFKGQKEGNEYKEATDAEVAALLIVAREHRLNPFLKEIFAFPAKGGGIVPVVGVDGWIRIVNSHPQYNGVEFIYESGESPAWIECHIHRKDRTHPIKARELLGECRRDTGPWKSHPSRMLRHKAFIQCARLAFGFAGIYDEDEAERIVSAPTDRVVSTHEPQRGPAGLRTALASTVEASGTAAAVPSGEQIDVTKTVGTVEQRDTLIAKMKGCTDQEILDLVRDEGNDVEWTKPDLDVINETYRARSAELAGGAQGS